MMVCAMDIWFAGHSLFGEHHRCKVLYVEIALIEAIVESMEL